MRKTLTGFISLALLLGTATAVGAADGEVAGQEPGGQAVGADIKDRISAIPGMRLIKEEPYPGYRYFTFSYEQPVDHRDPNGARCPQQFTLLHRDTSRPTVFHTGGYELNPQFLRSEPNARQMLFVNGEYDPWSAESFRPGRDARDRHVLTAPPVRTTTPRSRT